MAHVKRRFRREGEYVETMLEAARRGDASALHFQGEGGGACEGEAEETGDNAAGSSTATTATANSG